jgi:O-acetylserine/cysteine efflux transporter
VKPLYVFLLIGVTLAWGLHFSVIKSTIDGTAPLAYAAARMGLVAIILTPFRKWQPGQMGAILVAGACFGALNYAFMFYGLTFTTASVSAVVIESYVPIATVFSVIFLGERVGIKRVFGMGVALIGVVVIVTGSSEETGSRNLPLGALLIVLAATSEAAGAIFVKKIGDVKPLCLLAWFGVVGFVVNGTLSFILEENQLAPVTGDVQWDVIGALAYSVLIASIFGHTVYYWLIQRAPVSQLAASGLLASIFAVGFGILLLDEPMSWRFAIGSSMTLLGVGFVLMRQQAKSAAYVAEPSGEVVQADTATPAEEKTA